MNMTTLTLERIVDEAMAILATDGEAGLAMRQLATRLDVTPMALYRYVRDRDALLVELVERVSADITLPERAGTAREHAVNLALTLHDFLREHPWMIRLITTGRLASPAGLQFSEGFLTCGTESGLDRTSAFVFYRSMFATILGQATITHAKSQHATTGLPERATVAAPPLVSDLMDDWAALDAAATPEAVFRAVAAILPLT